MSIKPHSIHHTNFPISDPQRTTEWYGKVFGMRAIPRPGRQGGAPGVESILLLTHGSFDLHFTIHEHPPDLKPHHVCIELEDWDAFMDHLGSLEIAHTEVFERPHTHSRSTYIYDPDDNIVELMFHDKWNHESIVQPS